jgi:SNF2 family DNA or RNA helicase
VDTHPRRRDRRGIEKGRKAEHDPWEIQSDLRAPMLAEARRSVRIGPYLSDHVSQSVFDILKLHSAYRDGRFMVWGEVEPGKSSPRRLPFCARPVRIGRAISQVAGDVKLPAAYDASTIWLPTIDGKCVGSSAPTVENTSTPTSRPQIQPWTVSTATLSAENAFYFLDASNRNPYAEDFGTKLAPSTRFWGAALRFVADLALRDRFLPSMTAAGESFHARWKPLIAAPDQHRLRLLAQAMPPVARALTPSDARTCPEDDPAVLLSSFVAWMIDVVPRVAISSARRPVSQLRDVVNKRNIEAAWMIGLRSIESAMPGSHDLLSAFFERVNAWQRPVVREAEFPWLLSFELQEPHEALPDAPDQALQGTVDSDAGNTDAGAWRIRYQLEPVHGGPALPLDKAPARFAARLLARAASICADIREDADSFPLDVTGAFRFLTETAAALEQQGFRVVLPEWWKRREHAGAVRARPIIKPRPGNGAGMFSLGELMQFDWEVAIGGENYTREELDRLSASTAPLVKVHGKWLPFEPQSIRAALDLWKREPAPARDVIRMALGAADAPPGVQFEEARGEGWIGELLGKLAGHSRFEELPLPARFHGTLRPYQVRGFSWLGFLRQYGLGACLADDMGLGKTIQALALLERDRANGVDRPALLICPTSVVGNWRKEAARFAPGLSVLVHHGAARIRGQEFADQAARHTLVISSYALAHRDLALLKEVAWSGIILDEAQNIKNPETSQSRAARSLTADYRIALTGTPVENSVGELWSIMEFLNPGFLGNQAEFRRRFLLPIQKRADPEAALQLRKLTAPFILRRLKTDSSVIQDLPEKMEMKVFCNLTPEQASLYQRVVEDTTRALEAAVGIKRKGVILAALTKLKQVCNHPAQFLGDQSPLPGRSGKLSRLTEMAEELLSEGDHALIFSQFADMGQRLQRHLSATFGEEVLFLHGGVTAAKRDRMVERFQATGKGSPRLFVLSLKAGGTGLNLTAANHVFHFDRWWNPAVENQATDRAFRIGQKRSVQIHKFVCVGTLEERIDEMIERKKAVADNVIGAGEAWLTELSTAEIKQLFALRQEAVS